LNTKLQEAVDARDFRDRSRSCLDEFKKISWFNSWSIEMTSWSFDEDIIDLFEIDAMNDNSTIIDDKFSRLVWSSS
jgi:hypothetical protein